MIDEARTTPIDVSIVIPVYNEADNIESVARELGESLAGRFAAEVIFVDDGSTDDTPARFAAARGENLLSMRLIRHTGNRGQSGPTH